MFSSMSNHERNLPFSERFAYNNFEYYNIYEQLAQKYKDDLSKFIYHCERRSKGTIVLQGTNPKHLKTELHRSRQTTLQKHGTPIEMEQYIHHLIFTFIENNYSNYHANYEAQTDAEELQIMYLSEMNNQEKDYLLYHTHQPTDLKSYLNDLSDIAATEIANLEAEYDRLSELEGEDNTATDILYVMCSHAFELFFHRILSLYLKDDQLHYLLQEFIAQVHRILWDIVNGYKFNILWMKQPRLLYLNKVVHPLVWPISLFSKYPSEYFTSENELFASVEAACPRIVLLNLDGKESAHNLKTIRNLGGKLLYISLFEEPTWMKKKQTQLERTFDIDAGDIDEASFQLLCNFYSEKVIKEFGVTNHEDDDLKMLLFPLNSIFLQREYLRKFMQEDNSTPFPKMNSSHDISFLFHHIIYNQVQQYRPNIIFISYNGELVLEKDHWNDIVRNMTILAHHKVILFTNLTGLFKPIPFNEEQVDPDDDSSPKIQSINNFLSEYYAYNDENINKETFLSNISMFMKFSSGLYSLIDRQNEPPINKSLMGHRYMYLEKLAQIEEFRYYERWMLRKWRSDDVTELWKKYQMRELKENKKQNENYEKVIDIVIGEFLLQEITEHQLENLLDKRLNFKRKQLMFQLEEEEQLYNFDKQSRLQAYFQQKKQRLLQQNIQSYKTKKKYSLSEDLRRIGHVQYFKIFLGKDSTEEIYMERYTQVIIDSETVFIINYKSNDNKHMMLGGDMRMVGVESAVKVHEVLVTETQQSFELNQYFGEYQFKEQGLLAQKQDIIYVNYSYCFFKRVLYLFWPQMWNVREEIRCKLLDVPYKPKNVHRMLRVFPDKQNQNFYRYENILYRSNKNDIEVMPRLGCAGFVVDDGKMMVFGGIYDNQLDLLKVGSSINFLEIEEDNSNAYFRAYSEQKKDNYQGMASLIRPKINYQIEEMLQKNQQKMGMNIRIFGGYGRQETNFHNLFSYDVYDLETSSCIGHKVMDKKVSRRIPQLNHPIQFSNLGKFTLLKDNENINDISERFSDQPKDKFIFDNKTEFEKELDKEVIVFIDDGYRVSNFKQDQKKSFLFGFNRTIREKIYSHFWSPELYVIDGLNVQIVNVVLKTEKSPSYSMSNFLMPRQDDIVSLSIEEDRMYLLSNSSMLHSSETSSSKFLMYEGVLNMNQIFQSKEIQLFRYPFQTKSYKYLDKKSIMVMGEKIFLVGGESNMITHMDEKFYERQDYILERNKNKVNVRVKHLEIPVSSQQNLELPNSVSVKLNDSFLLYSIASDYDNDDNEQLKLKIQTLSEDQTQTTIKVNEIRIFFWNKKTSQVQMYPTNNNYLQLKFVKISPYTRFNANTFRELFSKILWRIGKTELNGDMMEDEKNQDIQRLLTLIRSLHREPNDMELQNILLKQSKIFIDVIKQIQKPPANRNEMKYEQQELLKDLKHCYSLISKLMIQKRLFPSQEPKQQEYRFFIEDKSSKKIKYIAIGPLNTTHLNFFRIRFKHQVMLCINQDVDEGFFYHPMITECTEVDEEVFKGLPIQQPSKQLIVTVPVSLK